MEDFPNLPTLPPNLSLQRISQSPLSTAQKLLASSLVTQSRSFLYHMKGENKELLILDVTHFLNHRINTKLINAIGEELASRVAVFEPDIILTAPSSGNIPAIAAALNLPNMPDIIYAPKGIPITIQEAYHAKSRSYTHGKAVTLTVAKDVLPKESRVLICDDFLDTGKTGLDLLTIVEQADVTPVGFCFVIEKPFGGREKLIEAGFVNDQIISLIKIESMRPGRLKLAGFDAWFSLTRQ
ncbi:xanthine phosphoribosyltransferase [Candidatus Gottesmanbacteria bacterium]|nr:xanthine phosphoribosyltransferase [Candidatus Gottesmanbacteria bacterium]MBI3577358.1 xanthine phosphoribosyltransferase [Candidatus Gottesmanbacteria bacterium]